jgi:hypothetical protein
MDWVQKEETKIKDILTLSSKFSAPGLNAFSSAALFMRTVP